MYSATSVRAFKNLFSRYHEPPALSKNEAQKLLDGLKTSFRDQLDREHGHVAKSAKKTAPNGLSRTPITRRSAADQHLKALLSNPLFSYHEPKEGLVLPSPTIPTPAVPNNRDPMDVFDHAVSRGMMNIKAATGCLIAKRKQLGAENGGSAVVGGSDTALRGLRWLRSSGLENGLGFLDNRPFVKALMPFLVSEGLEHLAWEWVTMSLDPTEGHKKYATRRSRAEAVLVELVAVKGLPEYGDLNAAITTLLFAQETYQSSPLLSQLLWKPWRSISWLSTVESYSRKAPNEALYNAHVATADKLASSVEVEQAHLSLCHPTQPSITPALRLFRDTGRMDEILKSVNKEKNGSVKINRFGLGQWLVVLGNDTVNVLSRTGRGREAKEIAELLQVELSDLHHPTLQPA